jgi:thioredoxin reductase (NADPH)
LFLVDEDHTALEALAGDVGRRYGTDYQITAERSPVAALAALRQLAERSQPVALLLAAQRTAGMNGVEFLVAAHGLHPAAKRVLLVERGDYGAAHPAVRAMTVGQIDYHLFAPWLPAERWLYPQLSDFLAAWSKTTEPSFAAIRIVGRPWEPRSHQLRDMLTRIAMPYRFYPYDSPAGRQLLRESGQDGGRLPVVIFRTGQVLVDPSHAELTELFGAAIRPEAISYDVAIVGAGPAGLAAAVSAASEGLRTLVLEPEVFGGQAGTSSLIRNYPGFPHGVSGDDLAFRTFEQAWLFGADPRTQWLRATIDCDQRGYVLTGRDLARATAPAGGWPLQRAPLFLETSLPGVFAAGDVRHRSVKRVASAVGEGAIAVQLAHEYLAEQPA